MSDEVPVVWLDEGQGREDASRALDEWARARGIRLGALEEAAPSIRLDPTIGEQAERELERAREAIGATDADAAERALARVDSLLRDHPELPQAAWLRAEVERTWSARWLRLEPRDETRARTAWQGAEALDGGRVPGIGETSSPPRPPVDATIILSGDPDPHLSLRLDGSPLLPVETDAHHIVYRVDIAPAEHHVVAVSEGRIVFASWVAIAGARPTARLRVTESACARNRFTAVWHKGDRVRAIGVACPRWIAAVPGNKRGSVFVARCEGDSCAPLLEWRIERFPTYGPPQVHDRLTRGWPSWATWALVGIGTAAATTTALIAAGVFEARTIEPRFVVGGARQE